MYKEIVYAESNGHRIDDVTRRYRMMGSHLVLHRTIGLTGYYRTPNPSPLAR